jgi:hypothetical protein
VFGHRAAHRRRAGDGCAWRVLEPPAILKGHVGLGRGAANRPPGRGIFDLKLKRSIVRSAELSMVQLRPNTSAPPTSVKVAPITINATEDVPAVIR